LDPKRASVIFGIVASALVGVGVFVRVTSKDAPSEDSPGPARNGVGITCQGPLTLTADIAMLQQFPPVTALSGCDLVARGIEISGVVGVKVRGGRVRFEDVTIDTDHPAIEVDGPDAEVFVSGARWQCGGRCLMVRDGSVRVERSELSADQFAIDSGGHVQVTASTLVGGVAALALHSGGEASLVESTLRSSDRALLINAGQGSVSIEGGRIQGRINGNGGSITGLETATIDLGAGAAATWTEFACAPIGRCLAEQSLGEFVADLRVELSAEGRLGTPDFVQKKLDATAEECILRALSEVEVPGPDGKAHRVRCTTAGQLFPGGATMASSDHKLEE
jgi:hypothetical protein